MYKVTFATKEYMTNETMTVTLWSLWLHIKNILQMFCLVLSDHHRGFCLTGKPLTLAALHSTFTPSVLFAEGNTILFPHDTSPAASASGRLERDLMLQQHHKSLNHSHMWESPPACLIGRASAFRLRKKAAMLALATSDLSSKRAWLYPNKCAITYSYVIIFPPIIPPSTPCLTLI